MARKPLLNIRLDEDAKARWEAAAEGEGLSLSTFVRRCVEDQIVLAGGGGDGRMVARKPSPGAAPAANTKRTRTKAPSQVTAAQAEAVTRQKGARTSLCPHRRKPDEYCSRCDA